jgi:hypothetical protein
MLLPILGEEYGKAVLRSYISMYQTQVFMHCHFYRHSDRGMAILAETSGDSGAMSSQVTGCYEGFEGRGFSYVEDNGSGEEAGATSTPGTGEGEEPSGGSSSMAFATRLSNSWIYSASLVVTLILATF